MEHNNTAIWSGEHILLVTMCTALLAVTVFIGAF